MTRCCNNRNVLHCGFAHFQWVIDSANSQNILAGPNFIKVIFPIGSCHCLADKVHGSFIGTKVISDNAPVGSVTDSAISSQLEQWIAAGTLPANNKNSLYFIYLDPGIVSIMGGSRSCQSYCGYHNNLGQIYYAVMPFPTCSGCLGGLQAFDAMTGTGSHELCEAITDAVPGTGWYDDINGEIGDICAWNFKTVAGYTVQLEWSNQQGKCV